MKVYKTIQQDNGTMTIYGSNRNIKLDYKKPDWSENEEICFRYRGNRYFLSEFMRIDKNAPEYLKEFHGIHNESAFSGVLIKLSDDGCGNETIKAFYYVA